MHGRQSMLTTGLYLLLDSDVRELFYWCRAGGEWISRCLVCQSLTGCSCLPGGREGEMRERERERQRDSERERGTEREIAEREQLLTRFIVCSLLSSAYFFLCISLNTH